MIAIIFVCVLVCTSTQGYLPGAGDLSVYLIISFLCLCRKSHVEVQPDVITVHIL